MLSPEQLIQKAEHSTFYRWLLNVSLDRMIPFNKPHGFRIVSISRNELVTRIPYRKSNFNHIRGLHACALATISEFTTGFLLISRLDMKQYRIIMQRLEMDYHYQGKMDAQASFSITDSWLEENIYTPLKTQEAVVIPCEVKIHDTKNNQLTTGKVFWQIKDWQKVKTRL